MGALDALAGRIPGLMASALGGQNAAEQERFRRAQLEREQARRDQDMQMQMQRQMLTDALLRNQVNRLPQQNEREDITWADRQADRTHLVETQRPMEDRARAAGASAAERSASPTPWQREGFASADDQISYARRLSQATEPSWYKAAGGASGGRMPMGQLEKVVKLNGALENIQLALDTMTSDPDGASAAFAAKNMLRAMPSFLGRVAGRELDAGMPTAARQMRAQIASVSSMLLNLLSGAAISEHEYERLKLYVPDVNQDTPATAADKLRNLQRELQGALRGWSGQAAAAPAPQAAPDEAPAGDWRW